MKELKNVTSEEMEIIKEYANHYELYEFNDLTQKEIENIIDSYQGKFDSMKNFAYYFYNEIHNIDNHLYLYIDWERVARDLELSGEYSITDKGYVFCNL